jgi:hypothetical protein
MGMANTSQSDTSQSGDEDKATGLDASGLDASGEETPVGDAWEDGQTEIGPHPELTHLENLGQADLEELADETGKNSDA